LTLHIENIHHVRHAAIMTKLQFNNKCIYCHKHIKLNSNIGHRCTYIHIHTSTQIAGSRQLKLTGQFYIITLDSIKLIAY